MSSHNGAALLSLLIRALILSDQGPTLLTSCNLNYIHKGLISKHSHIGSQDLNTWQNAISPWAPLAMRMSQTFLVFGDIDHFEED